MIRACLALSAAAALALAAASPAMARDYGQQGTVWPVIEPDLLEQIRARLQGLEASGAIRHLNEDLKRRTIAKVNRPEPVPGIGPATTVRRWTFDPTITLDADIRDDKGQLIMARGTRVNPLDTVALRARLVFIDGDDPRQVDWAFTHYARSGAKFVLVAGAPLELMKARQHRFYFDQGGKLVRHFGIGRVPAVVEQQGRLLRVTEQPPAASPPAPARPS